jgi:tetratricopeptide (TPR) repeat protein
VEKGEYDRAILDLDQAIRLDPRYVDAYNDRGRAYFAKHDYDRAIAEWTEAIRIDPNFTIGFRNRSLGLLDKKQYDQAIADLDIAIKQDPNSSPRTPTVPAPMKAKATMPARWRIATPRSSSIPTI